MPEPSHRRFGFIAVAWTFDGDYSQPLNQCRLLIGDVDQSDQQLQDEDIATLLPGGALAAGSIYLAAAQACELIASRYARQVTTKIGSFTANLSDRAEHYRTRARDLRRQNVRLGGVTPYLGGYSISDKVTQEENTDRVTPDFSVTTDDDQGGASGTPPANSNYFWPI